MDQPTRTTMQRQPSWAPFMILLLFYFFLSSPPPAAQADARLTMQRALARRTAEIEGLKAWLNGTAEQGRPAWEAKWKEVGGNLTQMWNGTRTVPVGKDVARLGRGAGGQAGWDYIRDFVEREERQRAGGIYLRNITGFLKGRWSSSPDSLAIFPDPSHNASHSIHRRAPISEAAIKNANISARDWNRGWFPWTPPNATTPKRPGVPRRAETMGGSGRVALNVREGWREDVREDGGILRVRSLAPPHAAAHLRNQGSMAFIVDDWGSELNLDVEGVQCVPSHSAISRRLTPT